MNTAKITPQEQDLIEKIRALAPERVAEVQDFVDFLRQRTEDRALVQAAARLSEDAFRKVWDNPEDADYDRL
jgi:CHASE3 domain sensor protein